MRNGVVPFYVVCDESYSMVDHIAAMDDAVRELRDRIHADHGLGETARICVIGFSDSARIVIPLSPVGTRTETFAASSAAATNFAAVFALLRDTIQRDVAALEADCYLVYRPTVFFLSDGQATDPALWSAAYQRLIDPNWAARPRIVALEVGDADLATIRGISTVTSPISGEGPATRRPMRPLRDRLRIWVARAMAD
jgi:uncharacterized protein YegL